MYLNLGRAHREDLGRGSILHSSVMTGYSEPGTLRISVQYWPDVFHIDNILQGLVVHKVHFSHDMFYIISETVVLESTYSINSKVFGPMSHQS